MGEIFLHPFYLGMALWGDFCFNSMLYMFMQIQTSITVRIDFGVQWTYRAPPQSCLLCSGFILLLCFCFCFSFLFSCYSLYNILSDCNGSNSTLARSTMSLKQEIHSIVFWLPMRLKIPIHLHSQSFVHDLLLLFGSFMPSALESQCVPQDIFHLPFLKLMTVHSETILVSLIHYGL